MCMHCSEWNLFKWCMTKDVRGCPAHGIKIENDKIKAVNKRASRWIRNRIGHVSRESKMSVAFSYNVSKSINYFIIFVCHKQKAIAIFSGVLCVPKCAMALFVGFLFDTQRNSKRVCAINNSERRFRQNLMEYYWMWACTASKNWARKYWKRFECARQQTTITIQMIRSS